MFRDSPSPIKALDPLLSHHYKRTYKNHLHSKSVSQSPVLSCAARFMRPRKQTKHKKAKGKSVHPPKSTCCSVSEVLFGAPHDFVSHWERFSRGCLSFTAAHLSSVMRWQVSFLTASLWYMIPLFHLSPTSRLDQSARFDFWRGSVCLLPEPSTCWNNKHCGKWQVTVQLILDRGEKSALHASAERPRRAQHCCTVLPVGATHLRYETKLLLKNWSQVKHICQVTYRFCILPYWHFFNGDAKLCLILFVSVGLWTIIYVKFEVWVTHSLENSLECSTKGIVTLSNGQESHCLIRLGKNNAGMPVTHT